MAGASLAAELAGAGSVIVIEGEDRPGYHATGRSAAFWSETYGGPLVQPLTTASGTFLRDGGFLGARGGLHIAGDADAHVIADLARGFGDAVDLRPLGRDDLIARIPGLKPQWRRGLLEPTCADIDVAALHAHYLKSAATAGARFVTGAGLRSAARAHGRWAVETAAGVFTADILVDAAGAWADEVAIAAGLAPIGIQPFRRTMVQLRVDPAAPANLPLVIDALGRFYFKPEAGGRIWLSPHDETPCPPCDAAAEEIDVATAIARLEAVVDWRIERVEHKWAGLRSFAPDRVPVYGFAPGRGDFFWFAGQGGFGIQTAPAAAKLGASLLLDRTSDPIVASIDPEPYLPDRLQPRA
ncbi:FAD-binding oxidoreductase [Sphingosinicella sp. BN140058]|uniref:NAD(P)/FAD-dependent oxidoreductase n=1 Tax=Sphingosinicella sp. BN140058 TaxID=1892855 RepID=UPI00101024B2|nr:FAD-binding oxidoreductase [Sphingosinicella sp. BN140058]QAY80111.1 FAD-binding oxidoreductase [Sphingosinicella sp. BN140058]